MKKLISLVIVVLALMSFVAPEEPVTIFMIGDSTMANKSLKGENQERGWGMVLAEHLQGNIRVSNHAQNGRSTKSFIDEGRWDSVMAQIRPGDYVFIQFGHNDAKEDEKRHTDPYTTFKANLQRFVREAKSKGAKPVIYSSIVRRHFEGDSLTDTHGDYIKVPVIVAQEEGIPYVDANKLTEDLVNCYGPEESKKLYMWIEPETYPFAPKGKKDDTHLNIFGANVVANILIHATAQEVPELYKYLK